MTKMSSDRVLSLLLLLCLGGGMAVISSDAMFGERPKLFVDYLKGPLKGKNPTYALEYYHHFLRHFSFIDH